MEKIEELKEKIESLKEELQSHAAKDEELQVLIHDLKNLEGKEFIKSNCNGKIFKFHKNASDGFCHCKYIKTYPIKDEDTLDLNLIQCDSINIVSENEKIKAFAYYIGCGIKTYDLGKCVKSESFQFVPEDEFEETKKERN